MAKDIDDFTNEDDSSSEDISKQIEYAKKFALDYLSRMKTYVLLLPILLVAGILIWGVTYPRARTVYKAEALIGPPAPSPVNSMIAAMGASGGGSSLVKRVMSGGGGDSSSFQKFQFMLQSERLADELAEKDGMLQTVFAPLWDAQRKTWRAPGQMSRVMTGFKQAMHWPTQDHPDASMLRKYLDNAFSIDEAKVGTNNSVVNLMATGNGYMTVSFLANTPEKAERILSTILSRADDILRQEQMRDVVARIDYINRELPNITQTETKNSLIDILTNQEEIRIMTVADKRFSYILISGPYASPTPITPIPPLASLRNQVLIFLGIWLLLVLIEPYVPPLRRTLRIFRRQQ